MGQSGQAALSLQELHDLFGDTHGTPMYGLKTPAAEIAQALLIVMRQGAACKRQKRSRDTEYETISRRRMATARAECQHTGDRHRAGLRIDVHGRKLVPCRREFWLIGT